MLKIDFKGNDVKLLLELYRTGRWNLLDYGRPHNQNALTPVQQLLAEGHVRLALQLGGKAAHKFRRRIRICRSPFDPTLDPSDVLGASLLGLCQGIAKLNPQVGQDSVIAFLSDHIAGRIKRAIYPRNAVDDIQEVESDDEDMDLPKRLSIPFLDYSEDEPADDENYVRRVIDNDGHLEVFDQPDVSAAAIARIEIDDEVDAVCSAEDRRIIELFEAGYTFKQIAKQLGQPATTLNDRYRKAKAALQQRLDIRQRSGPIKPATKPPKWCLTEWTQWNSPLYVAPDYLPRTLYAIVEPRPFSVHASLWSDIVDDTAAEWVEHEKSSHNKRLRYIGKHRETILARRASLLAGSYDVDCKEYRLDQWKRLRVKQPALPYTVRTQPLEEQKYARPTANRGIGRHEAIEKNTGIVKPDNYFTDHPVRQSSHCQVHLPMSDFERDMRARYLPEPLPIESGAKLNLARPAKPDGLINHRGQLWRETKEGMAAHSLAVEDSILLFPSGQAGRRQAA